MKSINTIVEIQKMVDIAIKKVGGYWRPLSAMTRLTEELGEVSNLLLKETIEVEEFGSELADLLIISTCLANQYCADLSSSYKQLKFSIGKPNVGTTINREILNASFLQLVTFSGQISRILNHYEGDKKKKETEVFESLSIAIARFQISIFEMAKLLDINLIYEIDMFNKVYQTLNKSISRDKGRFETLQDPITEESISNFHFLINETECPFAIKSKLWGACKWDILINTNENVKRNIDTLLRFTKCGESEGLDGFVFEVSGNSPYLISDISCLVYEILSFLSYHDPKGEKLIDEKILNKEWQFSFNDVRFFVSVFANCYSRNHPRYSPFKESFFILFQPEYSFKQKGFNSNNSKSLELKKQIRNSFENTGKPYDINLIDQRIEAFLYIMPLQIGDPLIRWWENGNQIK